MSIRNFISHLEMRPGDPVTNSVLAEAMRLMCSCLEEVCKVGSAVSEVNGYPERDGTALQGEQSKGVMVPVDGKIPVQECQEQSDVASEEVEISDRLASQSDGNAQAAQVERVEQPGMRLEIIECEKQEETEKPENLGVTLGNAQEPSDKKIAELRDRLLASESEHKAMAERIVLLEHELAETKEKSGELGRRLRQEEEKVVSIDREKEELKRDLEKARTESEKHTQQVSDCDTQIRELKTKVDEKDSEIAGLNGRLSVSESECRAAMERADRFDRERMELKRNLEDLHSEKGGYIQQVNDCDTQIRELKTKVDEKDSEIAGLNGRLSVSESECRAAMERADRFDRERMELKRNLEDLHSEKEGYIQQVNDRDTQIGDLNVQIEEKETEIATLHNRLSTSESDKEEARELASCLKVELSEAHAEMDTAKDRLEKYQNFLRCIWSDAIHVNELEELRAEWEAGIFSVSPDEDLLFMFANIFTWSSAYNIEKSGRGDNDTESIAINGLYNFSKALFRWLTNHGYDYEYAFRIFVSLSERINAQMSGGNYKIDVPILDAPYSSKSMTTASRSPSLGFVEAVETWSIQSTTSNVYRKKSLVKLTD